MLTSTLASIKLSALSLDFSSPEEYPISQEEKDTLIADWTNTLLHLELNTNSTTEDYSRSSIEQMVCDFITDNCGWLVDGFTIDWDNSKTPALINWLIGRVVLSTLLFSTHIYAYLLDLITNKGYD